MEKFILPTIEIVNINNDEIICTSGPAEEGFQPGPEEPRDVPGLW